MSKQDVNSAMWKQVKASYGVSFTKDDDGAKIKVPNADKVSKYSMVLRGATYKCRFGSSVQALVDWLGEIKTVHLINLSLGIAYGQKASGKTKLHKDVQAAIDAYPNKVDYAAQLQEEREQAQLALAEVKAVNNRNELITLLAQKGDYLRIPKVQDWKDSTVEKELAKLKK